MNDLELIGAALREAVEQVRSWTKHASDQLKREGLTQTEINRTGELLLSAAQWLGDHEARLRKAADAVARASQFKSPLGDIAKRMRGET